MEEQEQVRHLSVEFEDGATITLPPEVWLDQTLVRAMLGALRGEEPPTMTDDQWNEYVFRIADKAAEEDA